MGLMWWSNSRGRTVESDFGIRVARATIQGHRRFQISTSTSLQGLFHRSHPPIPGPEKGIGRWIGHSVCLFLAEYSFLPTRHPRTR